MTTDLVTQNQMQEVIVSGSEILQTSTIRVDKALSVGENIIQAIKEQGMSAELDERANKFLVNCRTAKNDIEIQRKPITTFFDEIRKRFTETEGKLDSKKADTVVSKIQAYRDAYVKKLRDEEAEKQRLAQLKLDKDNELIDIKTSIETQLSEHVNNHVLERKQKLQSSFNNITLENFAEKSRGLKTLAITYDKSHFDSFSPNYPRKQVTESEFIDLVTVIESSKDFTLIAAVVVGEIEKFKNELIEKLPSLKTSLDEMAIAGAEESKRLADEKEKRETAAAEKLKTDAIAKAKANAEALEVQKIADQTNAMMDNMAIVDSVAPETKDGFKITLLNKTAVAEIFTFWFQREGMTLTIDELEKKSIGQMKAYCEKVGHKSNDMIVSTNLKYEPVYKAVNRK